MEYSGGLVYSPRSVATTDIDASTAELALAVLDERIDAQRRKVLEVARRLHPGFGDGDLRRVQEFPDVVRDPAFQFEDGQLAAYVAAKIALKARLGGSGGTPA